MRSAGQRITIIRCVITLKSTVLVYLAAVAEITCNFVPDTRPVHMRSVVDKVTPGHDLVRVILFWSISLHQ